MAGLQYGMGIYSGWLIVASILNISEMLKFLSVTEEKDLDQEDWTAGLLWIAMLVFCAITVSYDDPWYGAVLIWAMLGMRF